MSTRLTIHAEGEHAGKSACGLKHLMASRLSTVPKRVTCRRCRKIAGIGETWAQKNARTLSSRKPPKQAPRPVGKRPELAAPYSGGDYPGVQLIDSHTLRAIKECDTDPRKFPMLRIDIKGYPAREVPNPIYVPPGDYVQHFGRAVRPKTRALNRGLDALLGVGDMPRMVEVSAERLAALEAVYKFAVELCDAIDAAEADVGGSRPTRDIIGDLGPATSKVDELSRRVQDENEG